MNFKNEKRVQRFGIRKLTIGAASVLLSTVTFMSMGANGQVKAAETNAQQPATEKVAKDATPAKDEAKSETSALKDGVTQEAYNNQKAKVADDQAQVDKAQKDVNDAQTAIDNAKKTNEAAGKVQAAHDAWKQAEKDADSAVHTYNAAQRKATSAKSALDDAKRYKDNWDKNEAKTYAKLTKMKDDANKTIAEQQKIVDAEKAAAKTDDAAYNAALEGFDQAKIATDPAMKAKADKLNALYQASQKHKQAATDAQNKIDAANKTIRDADLILKRGDYAGHKKAADSVADLQASYDAAAKEAADLQAIRKASALSLQEKVDEYAQARKEANLPNNYELGKLRDAATAAQGQINRDKNAAAYKAVAENETHVKNATIVLNNAKKVLDEATKQLDAAKKVADDANKALADAKAAAAKDSSNDVLAAEVAEKQSLADSANAALHRHQVSVDRHTADVTDRQKALDWWNKQLDAAKKDPFVVRANAEIAADEAIIAKYNEAVKNLAAVKDLNKTLSTLNNDLAKKQNVLNTWQDALKADTNVLNNMLVSVPKYESKTGEPLFQDGQGHEYEGMPKSKTGAPLFQDDRGTEYQGISQGSQSTSTDTDSNKGSQSSTTDTNSSSDVKSNDSVVSSDTKPAAASVKSTASEAKPSVLSANTKAKVAAIAAHSQIASSSSKSLPQTGMETNAAEALGLLALGLGSLAAFATKKREF